MRQENSTELSGYSFNNIYNKNDSPDPLDAKIAFVHGFPGFSIGNRHKKTMKPVEIQANELIQEHLPADQ